VLSSVAADAASAAVARSVASARVAVFADGLGVEASLRGERSERESEREAKRESAVNHGVDLLCESGVEPSSSSSK
jgi:hypothetical protein